MVADSGTITSPAVFQSQGLSSMYLVSNYYGSLSIGTDKFVTDHPDIVNVSLELSGDVCRKDTGEVRKLRLWSRGHVFFVRSCGFIDMWRPIYR